MFSRKIIWLAFVILIFACDMDSTKKTEQQITVKKTAEEYREIIVKSRDAKDFDTLEKTFREIFDNALIDRNEFDYLHSWYDFLSRHFDNEDFFDEWIDAFPQSHFAHTILGGRYIKKAWEERGTGWASSVTSKGWKGFGKFLRGAEKHLKKAYELEPRDSFAPAEMITVSVGLSRGRKAWEKWFKKAVKADSYSMHVYKQKRWALQPKWGGTSEMAMVRFARSVAKKATPEHHELALFSVTTHYMIFLNRYQVSGNYNDNTWWRRADVWKDIKKAYSTVEEWGKITNQNRNFYAKYALRAGHPKVAIEQFEKIGVHSNRHAWALKIFLEKRAEAFTAAGTTTSYEAQVEWFLSESEKALQADTEQFSLRYNRAHIYYYVKKELAKAREEYFEARDINKDSFGAISMAAGCSYDLEEYERAIGEFKQAIEVRPSSVNSHYKVGLCYSETGKYEEAIAFFDKALELKSDHYKSIFSRAFVYQRQEDWPKAVEAYTDAMKKIASYKDDAEYKGWYARKMSWLYSHRAYCFWKQEKPDQTIEDCRSALKIEKSSENARQLADWILQLKSGLQPDALKYAELAVKLSQNKNWDCINVLARASERNGMLEKALNLNRQLVKMDPEKSEKHIIKRIAKIEKKMAK